MASAAPLVRKITCLMRLTFSPFDAAKAVQYRLVNKLSPLKERNT